MTLDVTRNVLLWCTVLDYGILLVWFLAFVFAHHLSRDQFDAIHYAGMSILKIGLLVDSSATLRTRTGRRAGDDDGRPVLTDVQAPRDARPRWASALTSAPRRT